MNRPDWEFDPSCAVTAEELGLTRGYIFDAARNSNEQIREGHIVIEPHPDIEREIAIYGEPLSPSTRALLRRKQWGYSGVKYVAFFWNNGWRHWSLGVHLYFGKSGLNIEIHVPFGFFRIGRRQGDHW